nr:hypothetical protein [Pseudomonas putida]
MTILFGPQGTFGWFSYTTSRDTIPGGLEAFFFAQIQIKDWHVLRRNFFAHHFLPRKASKISFARLSGRPCRPDAF